MPASLDEPTTESENDPGTESAEGEKRRTSGVLAGGAEESKSLAGAMGNPVALLESVLGDAPPKDLKALFEQVFSGRGLYLYAH